MDEHRKYPRIHASVPTKLSSDDFDVVTETKNISANGVFCSVNKPLHLMSKLDIIFLLPFQQKQKKIIKKIHCKGVIVRYDSVNDTIDLSKQNAFIGIYFDEISDIDRKTIISYVNSSLNKSSKHT